MDDGTKLILIVQLATTLPMTGLIWFVQISHYPLFASVGADRFVEYEARHRLRTTWIVAPLMLAEALTTALVLSDSPEVVSRGMAIGGAALLIVIWVSTAIAQGPQHAKLSRGFDEQVWKRLVRSNWIRTAAWTGRSVLLLSVVWSALR